GISLRRSRGCRRVKEVVQDIKTTLGGSADEVGGGVSVACVLVFCDLWIGTERASHLRALGGIVVDIFGGDNIAGRGPLFYPLFHGIENAVSFTLRGWMAGLAKPVWARTWETVLHSGDHVETNEAVRVLCAHFGDD